tara:strand:+ start:37 stop:507 length:471 start_codon:yes stop_codon:yes gene_type:complete
MKIRVVKEQMLEMNKLLLILSLFLVTSCGHKGTTQVKKANKTELSVTFDGKEIHRRGGAWASQSELMMAMESSNKKVIIFGATWCKPCIQLQKVVKKAEFKQEVHFINLEEPWAFHMAQDLGIKDVPFMLYIDEKGDPIAMRKGANQIALYLLVNL